MQKAETNAYMNKHTCAMVARLAGSATRMASRRERASGENHLMFYVLVVFGSGC
jgi:hypothetical protein